MPHAVPGRQRPPAWPVEWEALNEIASRHLTRLGIGDAQVDAPFDGASGTLSSVVSSHFRAVVRKSAKEASLFCQTWTLSAPGEPVRLVCEGRTRAPLLVSDQNGTSRAGAVRIEVALPPGAVFPASQDEPTLRAWVLGKVLTSSVDGDVLSLEVKPVAVLRECDDHPH